MRKLFMMAAVLVAGLAVKAQDLKVDQAVKLNTERYNFGKIKQNVPVSTFFEITNTSDKPLVIASASGSCGCTTPEVPKEPIAPGASAKLKVNYNAAALNTFDKTVTINFAGITEPKVVHIVGETLEPTAYDTYIASSKNTSTKQNATKAPAATKTKTKTANAKVNTKAIKS